jgi:hypothetical protein
MKNLPTGIQSFSDLRSNNYLYVYKTEVIYRLVTTGKMFFLSRPRRFSKSLLVSTPDALFNGRQELFEGLYIYDKWDWTQKYPVVRIDWTRIPLQDVDRLRDTVAACIRNYDGQGFADCIEAMEQIHKRRYYTIRRSDACCFWASPFRERKPAA